MVVWPHQVGGGGGRGMGVPGAPQKDEGIVGAGAPPQEGRIFLGEGQGSWAKASNLGKGLSDTGRDRVAGQKLPCWGRGIGVLNLGGWY